MKKSAKQENKRISPEDKTPHNHKENRQSYGWKSPTFFHSLGHALRGLSSSFLTERNLRIELFVAGYVLFFSRYYNLTRAEFAIILLCIGFVITCELLNTALEKVVDLASPNYSQLAKEAKDMAAGAVLIASLASLVVGLYFFWNVETFKMILNILIRRWYVTLPLLLATLAVIFLPNQAKYNKTHEKDEANS